MADLGIIDSEIGFAEWENRQWEELSEAEKDHTAYRMAVYAAQVHCMDYNIGKLIESLKKSGKLDNTLIFSCLITGHVPNRIMNLVVASKRYQ